MNYNFLLDTFFSYPWLDYGIIVVYLGIIVWFNSRLFPDGSSWIKKGIFIYILPIVWITTVSALNPALLGYGKAQGINRLVAADGKLFVIDYLRATGGKRLTKGSPCYRLHLVDPVSGHKIRRSSLYNVYSPGHVIIHSDTLALTQPSEVRFYSIASGEKINTWSVKTLPLLFKELAGGVVSPEPNYVENNVVVNGLDGNKWMLDIRGNSIMPYKKYKEDAYVPTNKLYIKDGELRMDNKLYGTAVVQFGRVKGTDHKLILCGPDSVLNRSTVFLKGDIIAVSAKDSCFVVRDYDNIKKNGVCFTCMSLDGKRKLWELRQSQLRPDDKDADANDCSCIDEVNDVFVANIKNELFAVNMRDGKLLWRQVP